MELHPNIRLGMFILFMSKIFVGLFLLLVGSTAITVHTIKADTLYYNGTILTMAGPRPTYVEAVIVANNHVVFTGK